MQPVLHYYDSGAEELIGAHWTPAHWTQALSLEVGIELVEAGLLLQYHRLGFLSLAYSSGECLHTNALRAACMLGLLICSLQRLWQVSAGSCGFLH